jgi:SAM-dependent methyltransferase
MSSVPAYSLHTPSRAPSAAFQVVQVRPPGFVHAEALTEAAESVYFGLRRLGLPVFYREPPDRPCRQIVFGAHLLDERALAALPADTIIYNSEQIQADSPWLVGPYRTALQSRQIWDYSAENVRRAAELGIGALRHVPLGYVPELSRIAPAQEQVDVLFYGSMNPRRRSVLAAIEAAGLKVQALFGAYGEERDRAIAQAKIVLNMHFYEAKVFEIVRVSYLLTNAKAVVAECGPDTAIEPDLRAALRGVPYEGLVGACLELARQPELRQQLGAQGHRLFAQRAQEDILAACSEVAQALSAAPPSRRSVAASAVPATLHLGSGKDFRQDCFNVDVNPAWGPDAVFDLAAPDLIGSAVETARFGRVVLEPDSFETVIANDVLEHIVPLSTAMTNVLRLLKPGGVFEVLVPYDLSHGAWQDPTHVRAFNERSWIYYTDWHWYLGWTEARFDLIEQQLHLSPYGIQLQSAGKSNEEILRSPRAVDALRVRLRKRYLQQSERARARVLQPGRRLS